MTVMTAPASGTRKGSLQGRSSSNVAGETSSLVGQFKPVAFSSSESNLQQSQLHENRQDAEGEHGPVLCSAGF